MWFIFSVLKNGKNFTILSLIILLFASLGFNGFLGLRLFEMYKINMSLSRENIYLKNRLKMCDLSNKKQNQLLKSCSERIEKILSKVSEIELDSMKKELRDVKDNN